MTSTPRPCEGDRVDADGEEVIVGVDTHKDFHVAAVISMLGIVLASETFPATTAGYRRLVSWAYGLGPVRRAGVEGTGSYGMALARHLRGLGIEVVEVNRPDKATHRRRGKTDTIDAEAAAAAVLSGRAVAIAKAGDGPVAMMRMFKLAKASAIKSRTQAVNQLKAVLVTADPTLRESLSGLGTTKLVRRCAELGTDTLTDTASAARYTLRLLARRIQHLTTEIDDLQMRLADTVADHAPRLLQCFGAGPDTGADLLIAAGDNPDRLATEASYAALCGVSPVQASSGKSTRRRLNRGGDRRANAALYRIAMSRLRWDAATRAYRERRIAEGKTSREVIRCLKRYIAREIYQIIIESHSRPASPPSTA